MRGRSLFAWALSWSAGAWGVERALGGQHLDALAIHQVGRADPAGVCDAARLHQLADAAFCDLQQRGGIADGHQWCVSHTATVALRNATVYSFWNQIVCPSSHSGRWSIKVEWKALFRHRACAGWCSWACRLWGRHSQLGPRSPGRGDRGANRRCFPLPTHSVSLPLCMGSDIRTGLAATFVFFSHQTHPDNGPGELSWQWLGHLRARRGSV